MNPQADSVQQPSEAQAYAVPLLELLRGVPRSARLEISERPFSTRFIPVGRYCHEAAEALARFGTRPAAEPVIYIDSKGSLVSRVSREQVLAVLGPIVSALEEDQRATEPSQSGSAGEAESPFATPAMALAHEKIVELVAANGLTNAPDSRKDDFILGVVAAEKVYMDALSHIAPAAPEEALEVVGWEYRHLDTANTPNRWSEWERCRARNVHTSSDENFKNEIQAYIGMGFHYELRTLYAAPTPAEPVQQDTEPLPSDHATASRLGLRHGRLISREEIAFTPASLAALVAEIHAMHATPPAEKQAAPRGEDKRPKEGSMVKVPVGTPCYQDFRFFRFPEDWADVEFEVSHSLDDLKLVAPGFGVIGGDYGCGAIYVKAAHWLATPAPQDTKGADNHG